MITIPAGELADHIGEETGVSDWLDIDQDRINAFAEVTLDDQFIHTDPVAAAQTPLGSTVAHGFLTLSLVSKLAGDGMLMPEGTVMMLNYGVDRVRFLEPVKVDSRIRGKTRLTDVREKGKGRWLATNEVTIEIEGIDKPAMVAAALTLFITE
ncbi:MAG: MaoC family dehydratase [Acidimicrobiia bacterium]|nr:MAG: MaoC family dehydratase [Acidimicrobiia bacterium]